MSETKESLRAALAQAKRDIKDWQDSSEAYRHDAERAEAEVKTHVIAVAVSTHRAEDAEAECRALRMIVEEIVNTETWAEEYPWENTPEVKAFLDRARTDNEALRKELAETKNFATYDYMNGQAELSAVRKELAETKSQLGSARKQLETIWAVVSGLNPASGGTE